MSLFLACELDEMGSRNMLPSRKRGKANVGVSRDQHSLKLQHRTADRWGIPALRTDDLNAVDPEDQNEERPSD